MPVSGGGQGQFDYFFAREGGFKTNLNRKVGGPRQITFFFVYNLRSEYIFFRMGG